MLTKEKLFGNLFDDKNIIPSRLSEFTSDTISRLTAANGTGFYTDLIAALTALLTPFNAELDDVDTGVNVQKGKTQTNDEVMEDFVKTMSIKKGVIADALGGADKPEFQQFYPRGQNEYANATKLQMPTLVNRIFTAATTHATALGVPLTTLLKSYKALWAESRTEQTEQMGSVTDNRTQRSDYRTNLEIGLTKAVHTFGMWFPADVEKCASFFDFSLLYKASHHASQQFTVTIAPEGIALIINKKFTDNNRIHIDNQSTAADVIGYLAHTNGAQPGTEFLQVNAEHAVNTRPGKIGSLDNTFLLIKNLSDVNAAECVVEVVG